MKILASQVRTAMFLSRAKLRNAIQERKTNFSTVIVGSGSLAGGFHGSVHEKIGKTIYFAAYTSIIRCMRIHERVSQGHATLAWKKTRVRGDAPAAVVYQFCLYFHYHRVRDWKEKGERMKTVDKLFRWT